MKSIYEKYKDKGFEIVAVEAFRDTARAKQFIAKHELPYVFLEDVPGEDNVTRATYDIWNFPTTFLIDRQGKIRSYHVGFEAGDKQKLEAEIVRLLNDAG